MQTAHELTGSVSVILWVVTPEMVHRKVHVVSDGLILPRTLFSQKAADELWEQETTSGNTVSVGRVVDWVVPFIRRHYIYKYTVNL